MAQSYLIPPSIFSRFYSVLFQKGPHPQPEIVRAVKQSQRKGKSRPVFNASALVALVKVVLTEISNAIPGQVTLPSRAKKETSSNDRMAPIGVERAKTAIYFLQVERATDMESNEVVMASAVGPANIHHIGCGNARGDVVTDLYELTMLKIRSKKGQAYAYLPSSKTPQAPSRL